MSSRRGTEPGKAGNWAGKIVLGETCSGYSPEARISGIPYCLSLPAGRAVRKPVGSGSTTLYLKSTSLWSIGSSAGQASLSACSSPIAGI